MCGCRGKSNGAASSAQEMAASANPSLLRNHGGVRQMIYHGYAPTIDLADVPSGATYRPTGAIVTVYESDVDTLLARVGANGLPLFTGGGV